MNLARNIATTLISRVFIMGAMLVSSMVIARSLGPDDRGLFALILLLPELGKVLCILGFEQSNAVYAGLQPEGRRALVWHSAAAALVAGGATSMIGIAYILLGAPGLQDKLHASTWLYVLALSTIPLRLLVEYWLAILRGMNEIVRLNGVEVVMKVVSLCLVCVVLVGFQGGVVGAVCVDAAALVLTVMITAFVLFRLGAIGRPTFDPSLFRRSAKFAIPAHIAGITTYLNYRVDQLVVALMLPQSQLALYSIAVDIAERIWIVPGAISAALLPHLTNVRQDSRELTRAVTRHAIIWTGAGCLFVAAIAGFAVQLLYSSEYLGSVAPLRWLLPGIFALAIGKVLLAELASRERIRFTVWLMFLVSGINLLLNLVLIPQCGLVGASLASTVSYTLLAGVVIWIYLKETDTSWTALVPRRSDVSIYLAMLGVARQRIAARFAPRPALECASTIPEGD